MKLTFTIPCYEVANNEFEGEINRLRSQNPSVGVSYMTVAIKDESLKGKFTPGKTYTVTVEEIL